ncbi:jg13142 [Pararge aegeria aegeria]|uniref:Jg13142 protein n=1 Tax=Pararge aegeria aegeria TaxID=348720 RepID=A0A8S4RUN7_9NEOP|nr:jg13142 [Pararge aegeria aegeria]
MWNLDRSVVGESSAGISLMNAACPLEEALRVTDAGNPSPIGDKSSGWKGVEVREGRDFIRNEIPPKRYYVEDLGEDMLLVDSSKKNPSQEKVPTYDLPLFQKEPAVIHFNGAIQELNIGTQSIIGPWVRDTEVSSKDSESKIELNPNYFTIKESGLYFIYAQVVYLTHAPNCYFIWARQPGKEPRLVTTCATGDDSSNRPHSKAQISCSVHTITRLLKGDTVNMSQREQNRTLWLRPGYSYFGFIKLSS